MMKTYKAQAFLTALLVSGSCLASPFNQQDGYVPPKVRGTYAATTQTPITPPVTPSYVPQTQAYNSVLFSTPVDNIPQSNAFGPVFKGTYQAAQATVEKQSHDEEARAKARAEAEKQSREAEARAEAERQQREARARAEQQRREAAARARAEQQRRDAEARARAEQQRRDAEARAEAERRRRAEARAEAERQQRAEARARAEQQRREAEARAEAERQQRAEARARAEQQRREAEARAEAERQRREAEARAKAANAKNAKPTRAEYDPLLDAYKEAERTQDLPLTAAYKALGLNITDVLTNTDGKVTKAYRKLALLYHPDKPTGDTDYFKLLNQAFEKIKVSRRM